MVRRFLLWQVVVLCWVALTGCRPAVVKSEITNSDSVMFSIPNEYRTGGEYAGISLGSVGPTTWYDPTTKFNHQRGASLRTLDRSHVAVKYINAMLGSNGSPIGSFKEYIFKVDTEEGEISKILFTPVAESIQPDTDIFKDKPLPSQGVADAMMLLSQQGMTMVTFEIESSYSSEAFLSNFKKMSKIDSRVVEESGRQFRWNFDVNDNVQRLATCKVTIYPYKAGSKATVTATVFLRPESNYRIDAGKQVEVVKRKILEVVAN